jgi:hypothetical protein
MHQTAGKGGIKRIQGKGRHVEEPEIGGRGGKRMWKPRATGRRASRRRGGLKMLPTLISQLVRLRANLRAESWGDESEKQLELFNMFESGNCGSKDLRA